MPFRKNLPLAGSQQDDLRIQGHDARAIRAQEFLARERADSGEVWFVQQLRGAHDDGAAIYSVVDAQLAAAVAADEIDAGGGVSGEAHA